MSESPTTPPPLDGPRPRIRPHHRVRFPVRSLDHLFHLLVRFWAAVILGGLAVSALLSFVQNGPPGLVDPNKYLLIYILLLLVFASPGLSLAIIGTLLLLTAVGYVAHVASAHKRSVG
jgi:hypothetical protein